LDWIFVVWILAENLTQPLKENGGVIQVNAAPGFRMHAPSEGYQEMSQLLLLMLYPPGNRAEFRLSQ
jgi:hypothetical protein